MNEFTQNQMRTFRSFIVFTLFILVISLTIMTSTSQRYRISEIVYNVDQQLNFQSLTYLYGKSIWFVDENSFDQTYEDNPEVKNLSITKELPAKLTISVDLYQDLTNIIDLRSSIEKIQILFENSYIVSTKVIRNNLPTVEISNGPVKEGFNGEIISFFKTLAKYDYIKPALKLEYNGQILNAYYGKTIYEIGDVLDLGRKASILGSYLSENNCNGTVKFITSESTIEQCK